MHIICMLTNLNLALQEKNKKKKNVKIVLQNILTENVNAIYRNNTFPRVFFKLELNIMQFSCVYDGGVVA